MVAPLVMEKASQVISCFYVDKDKLPELQAEGSTWKLQIAIQAQ